MNFERTQAYGKGIILMALMTFAMADRAMPVCVSGFVTDAGGNPVARADIDFFVPATGVKLVTPGDKTDLSGFYNVCVLTPDVYNLTFAPPPGSHLMGKRLPNIDLSSNVSLDTSIVLDFGIVISGTVTDSLGSPVGNVDLDLDEVSGGRWFTPDDNSDTLAGNYWVVVPPGTYRIRYDSPPGTRFRGMQLDSVSVTADTVIDIALAEGFLLSGRVSDPSNQSLFDIAIDLREESTGRKVFISYNDTDTSGAYQVAVPGGLFQLRYSPPVGSNIVGEMIDSLVISGDLTRDQVLRTGVTFAVTVTDSAGVPVAGADLDLKLASTGAKIFTPNDKTNGSGWASVAILPDIYTVQLDPPVGTLFDRVVIDSVAIRNDTAVVIVMPEVPRVSFSGRVSDAIGTGLAAAKVDLRTRPTGAKVFLVNNVTDSAGYFSVAAPMGTFDLLLSPPRGSRYVGRIIDSVSISVDTVTSDLVLEAGALVTVTVVGEFGVPVAGVDLDLVSETTGIEIYTPYDNTDGAGVAVVVVPVDTYLMELSPPMISAYSTRVLSGVDIAGDTALTVVLARRSGSDAGFLRQNYPNPLYSETHIRYIVPVSGPASVTVYNVLGQTVKVLKDSYHVAGSYEIRWDCADRAGDPVASGLYFYRLIAPDVAETKKMIVVR